MNLYNIFHNIVKKIGVDYVVETGTSGIWTYRKWKSGIAECWGKISVSITSWSAWGAVYEGNPSTYGTYPSGLFIDPPDFWVTPDGTQGQLGLLSVEVFNNGSKTRTPTFYALRPSSVGTATVIFHCRAKGFWKTFVGGGNT